MSLLSANTLFHYTYKEALINIIKTGFAPRYSKEFDRELNEALTLGEHLYIPMVCFCDTPLSLVERHMDIYGSYGIGLAKDWGIREKLNPVFYINIESTVHTNLISSVSHFIIPVSFKKEYQNLIDDLLYVYRYLKPYKAGRIFKRNGKEYPDYNYYDEKEWRYVPEKLELDQKLPLSHVSDEERKEANRNLERRVLEFDIRDINFIIIENSNDVTDIMAAFRDRFPTLNQDDERYLLTTFITSGNIRNNF